MFSKSKKAFTNYPTKLTYVFLNLTFFLQAFFYLDPRYTGIYVPGDCIFCLKRVDKTKKRTQNF